MRRQFNNVVSVIHSVVRFAVMKLINPSGIETALVERFSPNVVVEVNRGGKLYLGYKVRVHSGSKLKVRKHAVMAIDADVKINYNCIFVCRKNIHIGAGTEFGPNVLIYDHDHDYRIALKEEKFIEAPVEIGRNCWIGANSIILRGTVLGDNCVIGAGSIVKGKYPANSIIIQKRVSEMKKGEL